MPSVRAVVADNNDAIRRAAMAVALRMAEWFESVKPMKNRFTTRVTIAACCYNAPHGTLASDVDGKGAKTTLEHDAAGNLTAVHPPAPLGVTVFGYD